MKIPPALAARATPQVLALLREAPPVAEGGRTTRPGRPRVLEVAFGGIHAMPLRLAGFDVEVLDDDPRALERAGEIVHAPTGRYDAVVAPVGADLDGIDAARIIRVDHTGVAFMRE